MYYFNVSETVSEDGVDISIVEKSYWEKNHHIDDCSIAFQPELAAMLEKLPFLLEEVCESTFVAMQGAEGDGEPVVDRNEIITAMKAAGFVENDEFNEFLEQCSDGDEEVWGVGDED